MLLRVDALCVEGGLPGLVKLVHSAILLVACKGYGNAFLSLGIALASYQRALHFPFICISGGVTDLTGLLRQTRELILPRAIICLHPLILIILCWFLSILLYAPQCSHGEPVVCLQKRINPDADGLVVKNNVKWLTRDHDSRYRWKRVSQPGPTSTRSAFSPPLPSFDEPQAQSANNSQWIVFINLLL